METVSTRTVANWRHAPEQRGAVADAVGVSHVTVGTVRSEMEERAEIPHVETVSASEVVTSLPETGTMVPASERVARELAKADPKQSNRAVAAAVGVDHKTVGAVRGDMETTGEIPQLDTRVGQDGKERPAMKPVKPGPLAKPAKPASKLGAKWTD